MPSFVKGNPGRPLGAKNKITRGVKETFSEVFAKIQNSDKTSLLTFAKKNPTEFYRMATKLIPTEIHEQSTKIIKVLGEDMFIEAEFKEVEQIEEKPRVDYFGDNPKEITEVIAEKKKQQ